MKLSTKFDYSSVAYNVDNTVHMLIKATAPKLELDKTRVPLNLAATLDVSPSMTGEKLEYARKSLMKLIDHLSPEDTLSIVSFDGGVRVLAGTTKMDQNNKDKLKQSLQRVAIGYGGTNLSGAILESVRLANQIDGAARVILFTDGQPNVGASAAQLPDFLRQHMRKNLSLTSFGYGSDHDSKLLTELAEIGKGNYAYLENPDDALTAFARELGGLLSCYGQNLKFLVTPKEKTEIVEVLSDVDVEEIPEGGVQISVNDLYSEETRNIVLKLKLDRQPKSHPRATSVAEVVLKYDRMPEGKRQSEDIRAKVHFVKLDDVQKNADQEVVDQVALCQIMKAQQEATVFASSGNFTAANAVFSNLNLGVAGVAGANPHGCSVSDLMSTTLTAAQSQYADQVSFTNSVHTRSASLSAHKMGRASHASNMCLYASNATMDSMVESFKQDDQLQDTAQQQANLLQNPGMISGTSGWLQQGSAGNAGISLGGNSGLGGSIGVSNALSGTLSGSTLALNSDGSVAVNSTGSISVTADKQDKKSKSKSRSKKEW